MEKFFLSSIDVRGENKRAYIDSIAHVHDIASWQFGFHRHVSFVDAAFVKAGHGHYAVGNQWIPIAAGDLLIVAPGTIHAIRSSRDDPLDIWIVAFQDFDEACMEVGFNERPFHSASAYIGKGDRANLIGLLIESMAYQSYCLSSGEYVGHHIVLAMIKALGDFLFHSRPLPEIGENYVADGVVAYIDDRYHTAITLKQLSQTLHVSSSCISHEMSSYYGISPIQFLINRRIGRAQWLLVSSDLGLTKISSVVGCNNLAHFTSLFMDRTGMMPREFRERFAEAKTRPNTIGI